MSSTSHPDDDQEPTVPAGTGGPDPARRPWQRRGYQVSAAVGLAAVVGAAAVLAGHAAGPAKPVADSQAARTATGTASAAGSVPAMHAAGTPAPGSAGGSAQPLSGRSYPAQPPKSATAVIDGTAVTIVSSGSLPTEHHTLRVVSARADLTGHRELGWAADAGHPVGDARCTQNVRFNGTAPARVRPTLLLCWRTSATRSAYTVAVDLDHAPSESVSVASLDLAWSKLG